MTATADTKQTPEMSRYIDHLLDCWAHPTPTGCTENHRCPTATQLLEKAL